jgi:hypothetical protein
MCMLIRFHYTCGHVLEQTAPCAAREAMGYCPYGSPQTTDTYNDGVCDNH